LLLHSDLSQNQLSDNIPASLGHMTQMLSLYVAVSLLPA
jgi:hypothetical protein